MQQCFDTWTHRGKYPVALTSTMSGGNVLYSGSYGNWTSGGWYQFTGLSLSEYQTKFNTLFSQGYRPAQVSLLDTPSGWTVNAIWQQAEGGFYSYTGMSLASFNATNSSLTGQGFVIEDLFAYNDSSNTPYFAATWVKTASQGQFPMTSIPAANYQATFNAETAAGRMPARVTAYNNGGAIEYAVLWKNANGVGFYSDNGWSESGFIAENQKHTAAGLHLKYVSALNNVFSGVWAP
jgi:hypothetical protein